MFTPIFNIGAITIPIVIVVPAKKPNFSAFSVNAKKRIERLIKKKTLQINANLDKKENPAITVSL